MSENEKKSVLTTEDLSDKSHEALFAMEEDQKNRLSYRVNEKAPLSDNHEMLAAVITKIENLSKGFQSSDDEDVRSAGAVLAELFKSLADQHTAELLNVLSHHATISDEGRHQLKKLIGGTLDEKKEEVSVRQETTDDGPKAEAVRVINEEKKNLEELIISYENKEKHSELKKEGMEELANAGTEKVKLTIGVLTILADSLENGRIAELSNIVSVDYPKFFADAERERCLKKAIGQIGFLANDLEKSNIAGEEKVRDAVKVLFVLSKLLEKENIKKLVNFVSSAYPQEFDGKQPEFSRKEENIPAGKKFS